MRTRTRLSLAVAAAASALALAGCLPTPPAPPPTEPAPSEVAPSAPPATEGAEDPAAPSTEPSEPPTSPQAELSVTADGSVAEAVVEGSTWQLELLEVAEVDLGEVEMFDDPEADVTPPPDGELLVSACFRATLVDSAEQQVWLGSDVSFEIDSADQHTAWDYDLGSSEANFYAANVDAGGTLDRTCPLFLVPDDAALDEVTVIATNESYESAEAVVTVP